MKQNVNEAIFSRMKPNNKIDYVRLLSSSELMNVKRDTIIRCIKEVGDKEYTYKIDKKTNESIKKLTRDKKLFLSDERRVGNDWNSNILGIYFIKSKLFVNIYFQMDSTDSDFLVDYDEFFSIGEYNGKKYEMDRYGELVPRYFRYTQRMKENAIKNILLEYIHKKYADKLSQSV